MMLTLQFEHLATCSIGSMFAALPTQFYTLNTATSIHIPPNAIGPFTGKVVKRLHCPDSPNPQKGKIIIKWSKNGRCDA